MENITIEGIVIRTIHYNESSEIVHLYTKFGNISVLAKGARKYKSQKLSFCEPLTKVLAIITDSKLPSLVDYTVLDNYSYIKDDLKKNLWFQYLLEIINKLPTETFFKNIYNMLDTALSKARDENTMLLVLMCQTKLLKAYGVEPNFKTCLYCNNTSFVSFDIKNGGFLCKNHNISSSEEYEPYLLLKKLYYFDMYNGNYSEIRDLDLKVVFLTITKYYEYHVEIKLHSFSTLLI